jgi:hypothetical protein
MSETNDKPRQEQVECPPARDPAVNMFILAGILLAFGFWCFYEAFILGKYPYPKGPEPTVNDLFGYYLNNWGGIILPLGGLVPLALGIRFLRRVLVADADGIRMPGKPTVAWKDVKRLDATDLAKKGIIRLDFGQAKPLVLDSWRLKNFKNLVAFVEKHVPADAIDAGQAPKADTGPDA